MPRGLVGFLALTAKILVFLILVAAVGLVGCAGYQFALVSDHFALKQLTITGVSDELTTELRTLAQPNPHQTPNLLLVDTDEVTSTLLKHPRIESVRVTKRYPNTLLIHARERQPVAVVACDALYLIDKDGYVLEDVNNLDREQLRYPFITGVETGQIALGQAIPLQTVRKALDLYACLRRTSARLALLLSEIRVSPTGSLTLVLSGGVEVRMGAEDYAERLAALELLHRRFDRLDRMDYVDLRFDGQIVYRPRDG